MCVTSQMGLGRRFTLALAGVAAVAAMVVYDHAGGAGAEATTPTRVHALVDGRVVPISVGTVFAEVPKVDGRCVIERPLGVGAFVPDGEPDPVIEWGFDDRCRAVIKNISFNPTGGR